MAMRTEREVEDQLDKIKRLRAVIPHKSFFGDDNWKKLDSQIIILERVVSGKWDECGLENRRDEYNEEYEENQGRIDAIDWILCDTDDGLADEEDIEIFTKKESGA